jgi:hypothetical protein
MWKKLKVKETRKKSKPWRSQWNFGEKKKHSVRANWDSRGNYPNSSRHYWKNAIYRRWETSGIVVGGPKDRKIITT